MISENVLGTAFQYKRCVYKITPVKYINLIQGRFALKDTTITIFCNKKSSSFVG